MNTYLWGYETWLTILLSILGFGIVLYAQVKINYTYKKTKTLLNKKKLSGFEVARKILDENGLQEIHIVEVSGELSDHYDSSRKVLRLSHDIFHGETIAALSVAAHETGHAIQDKTGYTFLKIRSILVPIVNLVSYMGYFVGIISIFFGMIGYLEIALLILIASILFQLVTLPVELDASKRALQELKRLNLIEKEEEKPAFNMLKSAALTYVASLISSILNLLRIIIMIQENNDRK